MLPTIVHALTKLCSAMNTPRGLTVKLLVEHEEYGQLVNLQVDPSRYDSPESYLRDTAVTELLRKCAGLATGVDTKAVAVQAFYSAETQCAKANRRLRELMYLPDGNSSLRVIQYLDEAKKLVAEWLGPLPRDLSFSSFGPGATFSDRGALTTIPDKLSGRPTSTSAARSLLPLWWQTAWSRYLVTTYSYRSDPLSVRGNRFTTVPKDATKDRGIAIEPSINVFFQLGVGKCIRARLNRIGIDLRRGQSIHVREAREASLRKTHATIDLSSASDTVCTELVKWLLPHPWWELLDTLRSPATLIGGRWHILEKFSSMGNGFTFELETLIFLALSTAVSRGRYGPSQGILVYGDDIIVPGEIFQDTLAALKFCGFTPNKRKTFAAESRFKESCGGDYFDGEPVRAHYLKDIPTSPSELFSLANGLRRLGLQFGPFNARNPVFQSWKVVLDSIPTRYRWLRGPAELGDIVIHDAPENYQVPQAVDSIWYWKCLKPVQVRLDWHHWHPNIQLAAALYGVPSSGIIPRGEPSKVVVSTVPFS